MKVTKLKKFFAVLIVAVIAAACLPLAAGCGADVSFVLSKDKSYYIMTGTGFKGSLSGELVIPETYGEGEEQKPVKEIAQEAFRGAQYYSVKIPATIEKIGMAAFANNDRLETATFAEESPLTELAQGIFGFCSRLTKVTLPQNLEVVGVKAFYGCTALTEIELPQTVKEIGAYAFASTQYDGLMSLEKINLPQGLERIGDAAFCYNGALKEVVLPDGIVDEKVPDLDENGEQKKDATGALMYKTVYGIGYAAFHSCFALEKATLPSKIETLRSGVFGACSALKEVHLGANLKTVEGATFYKNSEGALTGKLYSGHAFHNCSALTDVYFAGNEEQWKAVKIDNLPYSSDGAGYDNSALTRATMHYGE